MENTKTRTWLQRLKEESWEAELLVSAVAIFAILKSFSVMNWLIIYFIDNLEPAQYTICYFIIVCGYMAIGILAAMFTIHFALRAYWIGLVGLNSVFPDYGLEDSAYSPIYTKKILGVLPKISTSISKIDELCSVIFSAAFAFMMIYLYITVTASIFLILLNKLKDLVPIWILLIPIALLALFMVLGMLISIPANLKRFRQNETIQHLYFLYARWGAVILYGPLNKSILQISMIFGSNFKKKKGLVKMILFMLFIGVIFGTTQMVDSNFGYLVNYSNQLDNTKIHSSFFADKNINQDFLFTPEISSNIVKESTIEIFIPIFEHEIKLFKNVCEIEMSDNVGDKEPEERTSIRKAYLKCYQSQNKIFIDNINVSTNFLKTDHSRTGQYGLTSFIDLENLKRGQHEIRIQKTLDNENIKEWYIPFFFNLN